jgi:hypothetical protein
MRLFKICHYYEKKCLTYEELKNILCNLKFYIDLKNN